MILKKHMKEARVIGEDSFSLFHYANLPRDASKQAQVEALEMDQTWLRNHTEEVCRRIDHLIQDIGGG